MTLIYACIAPHAGDLIAETAEERKKIVRTRQAMQEMGATLEALAPQTIVIVNPHGFRVQDAISIAVTARATAEWSADVRLDFDIDVELAHNLVNRAAEADIPVARYIYGASGGPDCFIPLDWGAVVPLYFLGHGYAPRPKIVHISPTRQLSYQMHYDFGRVVGRVLRESNQRIAFVASADQGHAHHIGGPYGYDPASAEYDRWMREVTATGRLDELLRADARLVENGKPDSLWPTLVLAGVLKENPLKARFLSYEVNVYFGVLCAEFRD